MRHAPWAGGLTEMRNAHRMTGRRDCATLRPAMRRLPILLLFLLFAAAAQGQDFPALVEGTAIVTGTGDDTRTVGLAHALRDVLVKRSGDPGLLHDSRVDPLTAQAAGMVDDYIYLDRMSDLPKHDEQGTRERPYTLIARFNPGKVDAALAALGDTPWVTPRPPLLVRIMITDSKGGRYPLTADGGNDERHRQALLAAALRFGMRLVLVTMDRVNETFAVPGALTVEGTLHWSNADPGWTGAWGSDGRAWGIQGVSFDEAYRDLVLGAMAVATGHALPNARP
jgi:hypothetical protein